MRPRQMTRRDSEKLDEGFTLVEVLVSMVILAVVAGVSAAMLIQTFAAGKANTQRQTAADLASQAIEAAESQDALSITAGTSSNPVDGTTYTVTQTTGYVTGTGGTGVCAGSTSSATYRQITETVTWPTMGSVKPVQESTLRTLDASTGVASISVLNDLNVGVSNMTVTLTGGAAPLTATTDSSGCAVFTGLSTSSTYTATLNTSGYVGIASTQLVSSSSFTPVAATVSRVTMYYAPAGKLDLKLTTPTSAVYPIPSTTMDVSASSTSFTPNTQELPECSTVTSAPAACTTTTTSTTGTITAETREAQNLYPGSFSGWAGTCADAKPSNATAAAVAENATVSLTAALGGVTLIPGKTWSGTVFAYHAADASCASLGSQYQNAGAFYVIGSTTNGSTSPIRVALPQGTWQLGVGTSQYVTVTVPANGGTTTVTGS